MKTKEYIEKLLKEKSGIRLDIGCGQNKQEGFVGLDMYPYEGVDIVQDCEEFPWKLPNECVILATASHLLEHINPHKGVFIQFMDEVWRIMKPGGEFAFVVPYAGSPGYWQDPTHVNPISRNTLAYFDPLDPKFGNQLYTFYKPKPWKIKVVNWHQAGNLEAVLIKRKEDKSYEK